jgi:hypothetical protein
MSPSRVTELRRFGLTVGGAFLVLGTLSRLRGHTTAPVVLWGLGVGLAVPGLVLPRILDPVQRVWMRAAMVLGEVNSRIILGILFFVVFTPVGFVLRRIRDPLDRSWRVKRASDWVKRAAEPVSVERYERQF